MYTKQAQKLSTIFQLYRGGQFYWWRKPESPGKNYQPAASHWQTLSHNVVHLAWTGFEITTLVVIGTDCISSYNSFYHTNTTTTVPRSCCWQKPKTVPSPVYGTILFLLTFVQNSGVLVEIVIKLIVWLALIIFVMPNHIIS